jgi:hypothetical protein
MVFGPFTSVSTTSFSAGGTQVSSRTSERNWGITNRRVIVETAGAPRKTQTIPTADVRCVFVKRKKSRRGRPCITITKLESASGQRVKLGLGGLKDEARIRQIFPNAESKEKKGLLGFLGLG